MISFLFIPGLMRSRHGPPSAAPIFRSYRTKFICRAIYDQGNDGNSPPFIRQSHPSHNHLPMIAQNLINLVSHLFPFFNFNTLESLIFVPYFTLPSKKRPSPLIKVWVSISPWLKREKKSPGIKKTLSPKRSADPPSQGGN